MTFPGGVSQPTNPGGGGQGVAWISGLVTAVDTPNNKAVVVDQLLQTHELPLNGMRAKGLPPQVGERWILHKQFGTWFWAGLLNGRSMGEEIPQSLVSGLTSSLNDLGNNSELGAARGDGELFGDEISTCHRREMTAAHTTTAGVMHCWRTFATRESTATLLRAAMETAIVGGTHIIGVCMGQDPTNLPVLSYGFFTGTGVQSFNLGGTFFILPQRHIVFFSLVVAGPSVLPTMWGPPEAGAASLINPGINRNTSFFKSGVSSVPVSININDGSWTASPKTAWVSLGSP